MKMLQFSNYNPITGGTNRCYFLWFIIATVIAIGTITREIRNDARIIKQTTSIVFAPFL